MSKENIYGGVILLRKYGFSPHLRSSAVPLLVFAVLSFRATPAWSGIISYHCQYAASPEAHEKAHSACDAEARTGAFSGCKLDFRYEEEPEDKGLILFRIDYESSNCTQCGEDACIGGKLVEYKAIEDGCICKRPLPKSSPKSSMKFPGIGHEVDRTSSISDDSENKIAPIVDYDGGSERADKSLDQVR